MKKLFYIPITILLLLFPTTAVGKNNSQHNRSATVYQSKLSTEQSLHNIFISFPEFITSYKTNKCSIHKKKYTICRYEMTYHEENNYYICNGKSKIWYRNNALLKKLYSCNS
jgi:hypothetical protein